MTVRAYHLGRVHTAIGPLLTTNTRANDSLVNCPKRWARIIALLHALTAHPAHPVQKHPPMSLPDSPPSSVSPLHISFQLPNGAARTLAEIAALGPASLDPRARASDDGRESRLAPEADEDSPPGAADYPRTRSASPRAGPLDTSAAKTPLAVRQTSPVPQPLKHQASGLRPKLRIGNACAAAAHIVAASTSGDER